MYVRLGELRRILREAEEILSDDSIVTLQQWVRDHTKAKRPAMTKAVQELKEKGSPPGAVTMYRGFSLGREELQALVGPQIDLEKRANVPGSPYGAKMSSGKVRHITYNPRSLVDSWTTSREKAEEFAFDSRHLSNYQVLLVTQGTQENFRALPSYVYQRVIDPRLQVGPRAWEKETLAVGPIPVDTLLWTTYSWKYANE